MYVLNFDKILYYTNDFHIKQSKLTLNTAHQLIIIKHNSVHQKIIPTRILNFSKPVRTILELSTEWLASPASINMTRPSHQFKLLPAGRRFCDYASAAQFPEWAADILNDERRSRGIRLECRRSTLGPPGSREFFRPAPAREMMSPLIAGSWMLMPV